MIRLNSKKMLLSAIPCLLFGLAMSATEREYDYVFFDKKEVLKKRGGAMVSKN